MVGGFLFEPLGEASQLPTLIEQEPMASSPTLGYTPPEVGPGYGWLGGFLRSGVASVPELIGIGPGRIGMDEARLESWRAGHPWATFGSQVVAGIGPYGLGMALGTMALRAAPATAGLMRSVAVGSPMALRAPVLTPIARGALELAPFEAARIGGAAALGDQGTLGEVATSVALDLALSAPLFGAGGVYRALRGQTEDSVMRGIIGPGFSGRTAPQEQLERIYEFRASERGSAVDPTISTRVDNYTHQLELEIRRQTPEHTEQYIGQMWDGSDTHAIRRLFSTRAEAGRDAGDPGGVLRRTLTSGVGGFPDEAGWRGVLEQAGLQQTALANMQYPRVLDATKAQEAVIQQVLNRNLRSIHDGWRIEREASSSMFVMSKALPNRRFLVFKTADPNALLGTNLFDNVANRHAAYMSRVEGPINRAASEALNTSNPDSVFRRSREAINTFTTEAIEASQKGGNLARIFETGLWERPGQLAKSHLDSMGAGWNWFKGYMAPANQQFKKHPIAERVRILAQNLYDTARAQAKMLSYGAEQLPESQSIIRGIVRPGAPKGVEGLFRSLDEGDLPYLADVLSRKNTLQSALRTLQGADNPEMAERVGRLLTELDRIGKGVDTELVGTEAIYGLKRFIPMEGHFSYTNAWRGDFRQKIFGEDGALIGMGSGRTFAEATSNAHKLARRLDGAIDKNGPYRFEGGKDDDEYVRTIFGNLAKREKARGTLSLDQRSAIFRGGDDSPFTKRELADMFHTRVERQYNQIANTIAKNDLTPDLLDVRRRYGDEIGDQLQYRLDRYSGRKGQIDRATNAAVTKVLGNWLGNNAADKLVQSYNRLETSFSLHIANLGYLAQNAVGVIQTVLPQIALLRNVNSAELQSLMGFVPDMAGGKARGFLGFLDPLRIASHGVRAITNPTAQQRGMLNRAISEGVIAPKFQEEFIGQNSIYGSRISEALLGKRTIGSAAPQGGNWVRAMEQLFAWPAAKLEEITRAHAFLTGEALGRAMGIRSPEQLYQWSKQFTNRTMYQHTTADRTKLFNGPGGSALGLFKNWAMNNVADWGTYAGQATRGNYAPLLWAAGGNMALAGAGSLPLVGLADWFSRMFSDKGLMQHIYEAIGSGPNETNTADAIYFGLPTLLGISLQSQLSAPFSDPQRDLNFLMNMNVLQRIHKIYTLGSHVSDQWLAGGNPLADDRTLDLFSYALGPRALYKAFSEIEDNSIRSIRDGRTITDSIGVHQHVLHAIGLTPTRIARAYEASEVLFRRRAEHTAMTQRLGAAYAAAIERDDSEAMSFIVQRAVETGADLASVMRSASTRIRRLQRQILASDFRRDPQSAELLATLGL